MTSDDSGSEQVPVWPHDRYAKACALGAWEGMVPRSVQLEEWLEHWTAELVDGGTTVAVFQTPEGFGVPVLPERVAEDLETELARLA